MDLLGYFRVKLIEVERTTSVPAVGRFMVFQGGPTVPNWGARPPQASMKKTVSNPSQRDMGPPR